MSTREATSRRLILYSAGIFAAESGFFAVVPPLIPRLVHDVHLTTTQVGVLVAAYPAGLLVGAIPSFVLVDRRGVRFTSFTGLGLLFAATLAFGWGTSGALIDAARFVQGFGGGVAWTGALAWLTSTTSVARRGSVIGSAVGTALIGMVTGPAMGAVAAQIGRGPVFSGLAIVIVLLAVAAPTGAPAASRAGGSVRAVSRLLVDRQAIVGNGILFVIGIIGGAIWSLVPLLVTRLGGGPAIIAWILALGYLLAAGLNVVMGRLTDRFGRLIPTVASLVISAVLLPFVPLITVLAVLVIVSVAVSTVVAGMWTPTAAMVTDGAEPDASGQAIGVATMNASWAAGGASGALLMARLADVAGFVLPFVLAAVVSAVSALAAAAIYRRPTRLGAPPEPQRVGTP
jgi:DHA1 family bicyclomycin/chloramphenicol resistance-like MFS transporter